MSENETYEDVLRAEVAILKRGLYSLAAADGINNPALACPWVKAQEVLVEGRAVWVREL